MTIISGSILFFISVCGPGICMIKLGYPRASVVWIFVMGSVFGIMVMPVAFFGIAMLFKTVISIPLCTGTALAVYCMYTAGRMYPHVRRKTSL